SRAALACTQDPRERSLREVATSSAIRSRFVVSCRTHEFFQSPSWQEVFVLPMDQSQIRRFIGKYLSAESAEALCNQLDKIPALRSLAENPFFLRSMTRIDISRLTSVENRGQFLESLYEELLHREAARGLGINHKKVTKTVAKLAYRMIKRDMIGSQVDLKGMAGGGARNIVPLLATGLVQSKRGGAVVFYHQLIQEFFAAIALRERWVHQRLSVLLIQKKWSEVVVLWYDLERNH